MKNNYVKMFSTVSKSNNFLGALKQGSRSQEDQNIRSKVYEKMFSQYMDFNEMVRSYSGTTEMPILANQYFDATVTAFVSSFAGLLSVERVMDNPTMLLHFLDVLNISDGRTVLPNLGADDLSNLKSQVKVSGVLATGTSIYTISLGKKIIPGTIKLTLVDTDTTTVYEITDNKLGVLIAAPGVISAGAVNYATGEVTYTVAGFTPATVDTYSLVTYEDAPGVSGTGSESPYKNRFKTEMINILVATQPDMLIGENNIVSLAAMQKSLGVDPADFLARKLIELYTKVINKGLVDTIKGTYAGNTDAYDLTQATTGWVDQRSVYDNFVAAMIETDSTLATKSSKGVKATAYVCGNTVANMFRKTKAIGAFTENTGRTYVDDLIGYFDGVPVLKHSSCSDTEGFAIHKTSDGNMAPVARGIYLPLTNTPMVGNYQNPTQYSSGVYYQEGTEPIAQELVQRFTITVD